MRRLYSLLAAIAVLAGPAVAQTDASRIPDDAPSWLSMGEAVAQAEAGDKLILVHNYAAWCGWCARMDREVYSDDAVQAYLAEHYTATRVDVESDTVVTFFGRELAMSALGQAFGVRGTPTTVFVASNGELITKLPGYANAETFLHALHYVREGAYETMSFPQYVEVRNGTGMLPLPQAAPDVTMPPGE